MLVVPIFYAPIMSQAAPEQKQKSNNPSGSETSVPSSFEVASIRAVPASQAGFMSISPYGIPRFWAKNINLAILIAIAYKVDQRYITGQAKNLDSLIFDINAETADNTPLTYDKLRPLLQDLLEKRFGLAAHIQSTLLPGYVLVVSKNGPKLKSTEKPSAGFQILPDRVQGEGMPLSTLASMLSRVVHMPVSDQTNIKGRYDIDLPFAQENDSNSPLPSIYTALQEQLGLKLQSQKVPVDMLVVDHVNSTPTDN